MKSLLSLALLCHVGNASPSSKPIPEKCLKYIPDIQGLGDDSFLKADDPNIVGGMEVKPQTFPWQADIAMKEGKGQFCGGTIICPNFVMSAAHCNYDSNGFPEDVENLFTILVGVHDKRRPEQGTEHSITNHYDH